MVDSPPFALAACGSSSDSTSSGDSANAVKNGPAPAGNKSPVVIYLVMRGAGRVLRAASLMYGKRPTLPELVRWLKAA